MQLLHPAHHGGELNATVEREKETRTLRPHLPILPGMTDADNQPIRIDLPEEMMRRLRQWEIN